MNFNWKNFLRRLLTITLSWTLVSIFQFLLGLGTLIEMDYDFTKRDPLVALNASILGGLLGGILGGSTVLLFWEKWLRTKPYGWTLRSIFASFTVIFFIVSAAIRLYALSDHLGLPVFHTNVLVATFRDLTHPSTLIPFFFWLLVVIGTMIVFLVDDKYGPGVFGKFLLGKYFKPTKEERIFMFLDLRSSTSIAEKLGEEKYFNFLKEVFQTATPGILKYQGEIYQYVGDEIVVSWRLSAGKKNANCLNAFFEVQKLISSQKKYFNTKYGVTPEFKAGFHSGTVMAGEIGIVKRDIAFSGDVLNTTSRIQGMCNTLGVNILVSKYLLDALPIIKKNFSPLAIGEIDLRGKREKVPLFTIDP